MSIPRVGADTFSIVWFAFGFGRRPVVPPPETLGELGEEMKRVLDANTNSQYALHLDINDAIVSTRSFIDDDDISRTNVAMEISEMEQIATTCEH